MPSKSPLVTHGSWGLDSPRSAEGLGLCTTRDPNWWDLLPTRSNGRLRLTADNRKAKALCQRCPIRTRCLVEFSGQPTKTRAGHIAGGVVWGSHGNPVRSYS